jgi:hypothetical protein
VPDFASLAELLLNGLSTPVTALRVEGLTIVKDVRLPAGSTIGHALISASAAEPAEDDEEEAEESDEEVEEGDKKDERETASDRELRHLIIDHCRLQMQFPAQLCCGRIRHIQLAFLQLHNVVLHLPAGSCDHLDISDVNVSSDPPTRFLELEDVAAVDLTRLRVQHNQWGIVRRSLGIRIHHPRLDESEWGLMLEPSASRSCAVDFISTDGVRPNFNRQGAPMTVNGVNQIELA